MEPIKVADGPRASSWATQYVSVDTPDGVVLIPIETLTFSKEAPMVIFTRVVSMEPTILFDICLN